MDKRTIVKKRMEYPTFKNYGQLSVDSLDTFISLFNETPSTFKNAASLRLQNDLTFEDSKADSSYMIDGYDQYDIQRYMKTCEFDNDDPVDEYDYVYYEDKFKDAVGEVRELLGTNVYRMRYATLEPNTVLDWHVDQPNIDRFIIVLQGEQIFDIKKRKETISQTQLPGDVWYVNSNFEHRVLNNTDQKRLAILGCFDYNKSR